jgi:hypothetical protein
LNEILDKSNINEKRRWVQGVFDFMFIEKELFEKLLENHLILDNMEYYAEHKDW